MNTQMIKEIRAYLSGPRDYYEGVALYQRYGVNLRLKRQFAVDDTSATREMLIDELRKLAGLSEFEFAHLPRLAKKVVQEKNAHEVCRQEEEVSANTPSTEVMKNMIRFREKYSFLNSPDCPDILKVLVADMFTAYGEYKAAHARLQTLGDEESEAAAVECEKIVEEYLRNREIWEEFEYYRENGEILGRAAKFKEIQQAEDLSKLSDVDLIRQLQSAQVQVSKQKKKATVGDEKALAAMEFWSQKKQALSDELTRRKQKS